MQTPYAYYSREPSTPGTPQHSSRTSKNCVNERFMDTESLRAYLGRDQTEVARLLSLCLSTESVAATGLATN